MNIFRKLLYSKATDASLKAFLTCFYNRKYLSGKFFERHRIGYWWALRSLPRKLSLRRNGVDWPVGKYTSILNGKNITFDNSSLNVFQQPGCYYQAFEKIIIGRDVWIAPNVGIITANHKLEDPEEHEDGAHVIIGDYCWVGMNAVILPGVVLGDNTVVGAGSVVTKSFPEGHCVIAGNPARKIKDIMIETK